MAAYPKSNYAPLALEAKAKIEVEEKLKASDPLLGEQVPAALVSYRDLAEYYPSHKATEQALWEMAQIYDDLKRFDLAALAYVNLGTRFPSTRHDAWWEAAQLYDKKLDDTAQAVDAYSRVPSTSNRYGAAQKRLKKLTG